MNLVMLKTGNDALVGVHLYQPNLARFLSFCHDFNDRFVANLHIINDAMNLNAEDFNEFCLSFLRAYQIRQNYDLYRVLGRLPPGVTPSKLKGACDIEVPEWLLDACREFIRGSWFEKEVFFPDIITVTDGLVGRSCDNSIEVTTRLARNNVGIGSVLDSHLNIGIYIRTNFHAHLLAVFRGLKMEAVLGAECLEFAPLIINIYKLKNVDEEKGGDGKAAALLENQRKLDIWALFTEEEKVAMKALEPKVDLPIPTLDDYKWSATYLFDTATRQERIDANSCLQMVTLYDYGVVDQVLISFMKDANSAVLVRETYSWDLFGQFYLKYCSEYSGLECSPRFGLELYLRSLTGAYDSWKFPSIGTADREKLLREAQTLRLGIETKPSNRKGPRRGNQKGRNALRSTGKKTEIENAVYASDVKVKETK